MSKTLKKVSAELKRVTDFLEGICICSGPGADAFTRQQLFRVKQARKVLKEGFHESV